MMKMLNSRPKYDDAEQVDDDSRIVHADGRFNGNFGILVDPQIVDDLQIAVAIVEHSHHRLVTLEDVGHRFHFALLELRQRVGAVAAVEIVQRRVAHGERRKFPLFIGKHKKK